MPMEAAMHRLTFPFFLLKLIIYAVIMITSLINVHHLGIRGILYYTSVPSIYVRVLV